MDWQLDTYAVSGNNRYLLNLMLKRINNHLTHKWILREHETADAILVDIDKLEGRQFWQTYQDNKILVAFSWRNVYKARWFLEKPLSKIQPLMELFQQFSAEKLPETWSSLAFFEPSWYFLGLLQGTLYLNQPRRFNWGHLPPLYVLPIEKRCFTAHFNPNHLTVIQQAFLSAPSQDIEYADLSVAELKAQVQARYLTRYRIETFLWLSTLQASHGRLINGYSIKTPVRLNRWLNSIDLPYQEEYMLLAAFMLHHTGDLITFATKTKVPLTTVINFFNGCVVLDLVTVYDKSKPVIRRPLLNTPQNGLHRLLNRLLV